MSNQILIALRDTLKADSALSAFINARYSKQAKHLIGYKRAASSNDFPYIAYVPSRSTRSVDSGEILKISLVIGVYEPGITADIFDGVSVLGDIEDLIITALESLKISADISVSPPFSVTHDLSMRHPFHEREIYFELYSAASNADTALNASRSLV